MPRYSEKNIPSKILLRTLKKKPACFERLYGRPKGPKMAKRDWQILNLRLAKRARHIEGLKTRQKMAREQNRHYRREIHQLEKVRAAEKHHLMMENNILEGVLVCMKDRWTSLGFSEKEIEAFFDGGEENDEDDGMGSAEYDGEEDVVFPGSTGIDRQGDGHVAREYQGEVQGTGRDGAICGGGTGGTTDEPIVID